MGYKLTIHDKKDVTNNYWFNSFKYDNTIIDEISDPTGGSISKLLTAIPSPFARMHMFETAFEFVRKGLLKNQSNSVAFEKLISECFDMYELLFNINQYKASGHSIIIQTWNLSTHIDELINSINNVKHQQLGRVLNKYIRSNTQINAAQNIYLFSLDQKVFGGSSPYTGFFTKPEIEDFPIKKTDGTPFFQDITPVWERNSAFLIALAQMFSLNSPGLSHTAKSVYQYLLVAFPRIKNNALLGTVTTLINGQIPNTTLPKFSELTDEQGGVLLIGGSHILIQDNSPQVLQSPLTISPSVTNTIPNAFLPLVLRKGTDYLGRPVANISIPTNAGPIGALNTRILPGNGLRYPFLVVDDFLEDYLIQLPYPVNSSRFYIPKLDNMDEEKDDGFLLPIKASYFNYFDEHMLQRSLSIAKVGNGFRVELLVPVSDGSQVKFEKFYYTNPEGEAAGKLCGSCNIFLAFYPLIKTSVAEFDNIFKVMLVDNIETTASVELFFYDENNTQIAINAGNNKKVSKTCRVAKTKENYGGSTYFETNFPYKFLEVHIPESDISAKKMRGILIPKYKQIALGTKVFDVAVDFGTTNTHVALLEYKHGNLTTIPQSLILDETDMQTVLYNQSKDDPNLSLTQKYEQWDSHLEVRLIERLKHEFVPSIIGAGFEPKYEFPMRTAVSTSKTAKAGGGDLFGDSNISFAYEKEPQRSDEDVATSLKWNISDSETEAKVILFIHELLIILRNKILLNGGDPRNCKLIWFKPLSMSEIDQVHYTNIWHNELKAIFNTSLDIENEHCVSLTESCAPFYYYSALDKVGSSVNPVLSIDIGGGSTDVSFFLNKKPQFGTSFNYAGNSIWHPGLSGRSQELVGLYKRYGTEFISDLIKRSSGAKVEIISKIFATHASYYGKGLQSENLFNLYFTWDEVLNFTGELRRDPYVKFLILFHFSSIVYHCTKLLQAKNISKPHYICISGRGSKYLKIIDPSADLKLLNGFIDLFIAKITGQTNGYKSILVRVDAEKEATSIGGLYLLADSREQKNAIKDKDTPESIAFYGEKAPQFKKKLYKEIDTSFKQAVLENVTDFIDTLLSIDEEYSFKEKLGISLPENYEVYRKFLIDNAPEYLDKGLEHRMKTSKESESINEPLFFYPLIPMLLELGKFFYGN
jgi:hypothetical protein